jgi:hypothetical protein
VSCVSKSCVFSTPSVCSCSKIFLFFSSTSHRLSSPITHPSQCLRPSSQSKTSARSSAAR